MLIRLGILLGLLMVSGVLAAEDTRYVQSERAEVFETPAFDAARVGELQRGDPVERLSEEGDWLEIRAGELEGWVSTLLLGDSEPSARVSPLHGDEELEMEGRRRASAVATAGGVRSLEEDEELVADENVDVDQLHALEAQGVSTEEAIRFLHERDEDAES